MEHKAGQVGGEVQEVEEEGEVMETIAVTALDMMVQMADPDVMGGLKLTAGEV